MTRWARAKNPHRHEKQPEDATSWSEFVEQMKNRKRTSSEPEHNAKRKKPNEVGDTKSVKESVESQQFKVAKQLKSKKAAVDLQQGDVTNNTLLDKTKKKQKKKKNQQKLKKNKKTVVEDENPVFSGFDEQTFEDNVDETGETALDSSVASKGKVSKAVKKKKKVKKAVKENHEVLSDGTESREHSQKSVSLETDSPLANVNDKTEMKKKKKKKLKKKCSKKMETHTDRNPDSVADEINEDSTLLFDSHGNSKDQTKASPEMNSPGKNKISTWMKKVMQSRQEKNMLLLPKKVEDKLYNLKKTLRKRGVSGEKIRNIVRKERRKYELQYRKELKQVCFHCRKPGHMVADCPRIQADSEQGMDICFKCGSTEHKIYQCTAKKGKDDGEFPFAKCFVCGQQGHLSRNCPQNAHGVFPKGGACRICGSKEHLKKDCPELAEGDKKGEDEVVAYTMDSKMSADAEISDSEARERKKKKMKVVKF